MRWPELPRLTPPGCPDEHPILRGLGGHPPLRGTTLGYFSRVAGPGYAQPPTLCGSRDGCTRCFLAVPSQDYLLDRFRPCSPSGLPTLLPALGPRVHTTPRRFPPRCYAYSRTRPIHPVQPSPFWCDDQMQPSYCFQGCHPYSPVSPRPLRSPTAFTMVGSAASGLVRGRFPRTLGSPPRRLVGVLRPSSHRPACVHLSERYLAHADYSCRRGSPVDSTAQGVTPDFVHPPFSPTGLPPGRFVVSFLT